MTRNRGRRGPGRHDDRTDGRAVSDLIGFVLMFTIVLTGATLVVTLGQGQLNDLRTGEQQENAERAMVLLGQNFEEIEYSRATVAGGTIDLDRGTLERTDGASLEFSVTTGGGTYVDTVPTGGITYRLEDAAIRYESGMVARSDPGGVAVLTDPRLRCRAVDGRTRALVSVTSLAGDGGRAVGGTTTEVVARDNGSGLVYPRNRSGAATAADATALRVTVDSPVEDAWARYFDRAAGWTAVGADTYECAVGAGGTVVVRQAAMNVSLSG